MIGKLGNIPFEVSFDGKNKKILNFINLKLSSGANYEKHVFFAVYNNFQNSHKIFHNGDLIYNIYTILSNTILVFSFPPSQNYILIPLLFYIYI